MNLSAAAAAPVIDATFEEVVLPHLGAAHRLARRLLRNRADAEDVVQEASLRAFRYFRTFTGGNGRAWFLKIVRNTCWGWNGRGANGSPDSFDEERHSTTPSGYDPERQVLQADDARLIARAMQLLPHRSRVLLELRELHGLSYRELADAMDLPVGTVMSRLSRARQAFRTVLDSQLTQNGTTEGAHLREQSGPSTGVKGGGTAELQSVDRAASACIQATVAAEESSGAGAAWRATVLARRRRPSSQVQTRCERAESRVASERSGERIRPQGVASLVVAVGNLVHPARPVGNLAEPEAELVGSTNRSAANSRDMSPSAGP